MRICFILKNGRMNIFTLTFFYKEIYAFELFRGEENDGANIIRLRRLCKKILAKRLLPKSGLWI